MSSDPSYREPRRAARHEPPPHRTARRTRRCSRPSRPLLAFLPALLLAPGSAIATTCPYNGGWALRTNLAACPPLAPIDCGSGLQARCCPSGFVCAGDGAYQGNYCCVSGQDCRAEASSVPECPSQSWSLWGVDGKVDQGGWCCLQGMVGAYQNDSSLGSNFGVGCFPSTATLGSKLGLATTVATTACTPSSSSSTTSSVSTTSTPSSTSTTSTTPLPANTDTGGGGGGGGGGSSLSPGGIAGAVVGSIAGIAILAGLGVFLLRRRKTTNTTTELAGAEAWKHEDTQSPWKTSPEQGQMMELPDSERHEMQAHVPPVRHELPS